MNTTPRRSRRTFLNAAGFAALGATLSACGASGQSTGSSDPSALATFTPEPDVANADEALQRLVEGNARYVANKSLPIDESESRRIAVAQGQHPFATIFSCVDSRVPPELVFDRGLGDLFVIRTAGQVIDRAVLGSLEFGVAELHIPLLVVLGHSKCGAVSATIDAVGHGGHGEADIDVLVESIRPAVEQARGQAGDLLDNAVRTNIGLTVARLRESPILKEAFEAGTLKIVGARYDLESGKVELLS